MVGHIKPAVAGKPRQQHIFKSQSWRFASGGKVLQILALSGFVATLNLEPYAVGAALNKAKRRFLRAVGVRALHSGPPKAKPMAGKD